MIDTGSVTDRRSVSADGRSATFPETPVGRAAREYLRVYNEGDTVRIRQFLEARVVRRPDDTRTIDERVAAFRAMHRQMGDLTPLRVTPSGENELTISAHSSDGVVTIVFTVEREAPNRITGIRVQQG